MPIPPKLAQECQYGRPRPRGTGSEGDVSIYQEVRSYVQPPLRVQNGTPERATFGYGEVPGSSSGYIPGLGHGSLSPSGPHEFVGDGSGLPSAFGTNVSASASLPPDADGLVGHMDALHLGHPSLLTSLNSSPSYHSHTRSAPSNPLDARRPAGYHADAGPLAVGMLEMDERASIYDMPPPAYDAIDFNAPSPVVADMRMAQSPGSGHLRHPLPRTLPSLPSQAQSLQR